MNGDLRELSICYCHKEGWCWCMDSFRKICPSDQCLWCDAWCDKVPAFFLVHVCHCCCCEGSCSECLCCLYVSFQQTAVKAEEEASIEMHDDDFLIVVLSCYPIYVHTLQRQTRDYIATRGMIGAAGCFMEPYGRHHHLHHHTMTGFVLSSHQYHHHHLRIPPTAPASSFYRPAPSSCGGM